MLRPDTLVATLAAPLSDGITVLCPCPGNLCHSSLPVVQQAGNTAAANCSQAQRYQV
jgi:hypothetical protein